MTITHYNMKKKGLPGLSLTRRFLRFFLLVLFLVGILFNGCSSKPKQSDKPALIYWSSNNQDEINLAKVIVEEWNKDNPEIQVEFQPVPEGESSEEVILAAVVGKTTPDIYSNMWPGDVESYVRAEQLIPFDQFEDFNRVSSERFTPSMIDEAKSRNGHIYQILWKTNPIMLIYNKKMLRNVGFDHPPETYEEYLTAARRMSQDTDGDGYVDRWVGISDIRARWRDRLFDFYPLYIAASGGKTLIKDGQIAFENEHAINVFRFFQEIYLNGYFPREITTVRRDFFLTELAASRIVGPWEIMHTEKFKPEGFEYGFVHIPVPDGLNAPYYTYGDLKSIVVFRNTQYPKAAWEFIKFMISKKNDLRLMEIATQLPFRKKIIEDNYFRSYFSNNPRMIAFAEMIPTLRGVDNSPTLKEIFDAISQEFEACVVYGAKTPEEAVKDAAQRAKLVYE
jgi:multiple sugar transport system substrate-binding protein